MGPVRRPVALLSSSSSSVVSVGGLVVCCCLFGFAWCLPWNVVGETREVRTGQGRVRGLLVAPNHNEKLNRVEVYLGLPYAAPPVGALRFMPPVSPHPWSGLRIANKLGPVCPQNVTILEQEARKMTTGRMNYLKKLIPYLKNQSEDCLHLNIYAPAQEFSLGPSRVPVLVFIHGESFHWNSGNPYDGSTLASYAQVIVVTINYRLGILGFLRPAMNVHTMSNFGLLDQIAALQWVKENIAQFGGDPTSVTLIGHHTGAVCVNYLMLSPVVQPDRGLFHRAILMSGSGLSDWAGVAHPDQDSLQVAEALNCPHHGDHLVACLRKKRVADILGVQLSRPLGPIVDGNVIPNDPKGLMANYSDFFTSYDLMCGVTEAESYNMLDAQSLARGLLDVRRDEILKEYFRDKFQIYPEMAQAKATLFYRESERGRSAGENSREATISLLSDSRVVAPLVQAAIYHSRPNAQAKTYMYVFSHRSKYSEYSYAEKSVYGEDIPYLLGIPLDGPRFHYNYNYNIPEHLLSEVMMTLWTNFAKTGNPNTPRKQNYLTLSESYWLQYDILWPEFDPQHQAYYRLDIPPKIEHKYRSEYLHFWNNDLPQYLMNPSRPSYTRYPVQLPELVPEDPNTYPDPWGTIRGFDRFRPRPTTKPIYGYVNQHPRVVKGDRFFNEPDENNDVPSNVKTQEPAEPVEKASSLTVTIIFILGVCFLVVNIVSFAFVCYQKRRMKNRIDFSSRYRCGSSPSLPDFVDPYEEKEPEKNEVKSILKPGGASFEAVKTKDKKWPGMYRQASSSTMTMDPHTKVTEWIAQEIVNKSTPNLSAGKEKAKDKDSDKGSTATTSRIHNKKVKKVSVAVDATPSARSASVLKQTPIELTKSMDSLSKKRDREEKGTKESGEVKGEDVNVTSRDERAKELESPRTPEDSLDNIKRRNFPKVLPDFDHEGSKADKRMSLPQYNRDKKVPPPPPPRISTLGRPRDRNTVADFSHTYANLPVKRVEPRVVIKPTLADPNQKSADPRIPRVTHRHSPEKKPPSPLPEVKKEIEPTKKEEPPSRPPGIGAPLKINPVKKTATSEPEPEPPLDKPKS